MDIGAFLLYLASAFAIADAVLLLSKEKWKTYGKQIAFLTSGIVTIIFLLLIYYFLTDNFSIYYVWLFSSRDLDLVYKSVAIWAGAEGSLLLWTFLIYVQYAYFRLKARGEDEALRRAFFAASSFGLFLLILMTTTGVFRPTPGIELLHLPDGYGLNPALRNFWMIFHPLVIFIGYASATVPLAIAMTNLSLGKIILEGMNILFLRLCWLFLALGNILGGVWAYEALGWGGYWAWDPLETASLLPWITCTAYFHARTVRKDLGRTLEVTAILTFLLVVFATLVTRAGIIKTIHGYAPAPLIAKLFLAYVAAVLFFTFYFLAKGPAIKVGGRSGSYPLLSMRNLHLVAYFSLAIIAIVCFLGTIRQQPIGYFNLYCYPLTITFTSALVACGLLRYVNRRSIVALLGASWLLGGFSFAILKITGHPFADFGIPVVVIGILALVYTIIAKKMRGFEISQRLIHIGLLVILLGVFLSSTVKVEHVLARVPVGESAIVPGTNIAISLDSAEINLAPYEKFNYIIYRPIHGMFLPQPKFYEAYLTISVYEDGVLLGRGKIFATSDWRWGNFSSLFIPRTFFYDIYIHVFIPPGDYPYVFFNPEDPTSIMMVTFDVSRPMYVNIVWLGCIVMTVALIPTAWLSARLKKEAKART